MRVGAIKVPRNHLEQELKKSHIIFEAPTDVTNVLSGDVGTSIVALNCGYIFFLNSVPKVQKLYDHNCNTSTMS